MLERLTYGLGLLHGLGNYAAGTGGPAIWRSMAWSDAELQDHYDDVVMVHELTLAVREGSYLLPPLSLVLSCISIAVATQMPLPSQSLQRLRCLPC